MTWNFTIDSCSPVTVWNHPHQQSGIQEVSTKDQHTKHPRRQKQRRPNAPGEARDQPPQHHPPNPVQQCPFWQGPGREFAKVHWHLCYLSTRTQTYQWCLSTYMYNSRQPHSYRYPAPTPTSSTLVDWHFWQPAAVRVRRRSNVWLCAMVVSWSHLQNVLQPSVPRTPPRCS